MTETAVEWLEKEIEKSIIPAQKHYFKWAFEQAKEMEKTNIDNKVIHFAEWLTNKHTLTLIALYEQFEEEFYNKKS